MEIKSAEFVISNTNAESCPKGDKPEYAFIGRSNVGKSSLINMLVNHKNLAKTSSTPGKTQLINHFLINKNWFLVDLPGYGFAKISKERQSKWERFIQQYLKNRENLMCLFVLLDSRLEPQALDLEFVDSLGELGVPFVLVFTKADKLSGNEVTKNKDAFCKELQNTWEELPQIFITSSETKKGRKEILDFIEKSNDMF